MTEEQLIEDLALILDKTELQVKQTPYVTLLREMVEAYVECVIDGLKR
jgi:hypothetical protein